MRRRGGFAVGCVLVFTGAHPAASEVVTLTAVRDNTLIESATGSLSNGAGTFLFTGRTAQSSGAVRRGILAFDVTGIPAGAKIQSVVLTLHLSRAASSEVHDVRIHRVLADWGEGDSIGGSGEGAGAPAAAGDATWVHASFSSRLWSSPGGDFAPAASATAPVGTSGAVSWNSTPGLVADVQSWVDVPGTAHGWTLIGNEAVARSAKRFFSRQHPMPSIRPALTVTFDPPTPIAADSWSRIKNLFR